MVRQLALKDIITLGIAVELVEDMNEEGTDWADEWQTSGGEGRRKARHHRKLVTMHK